VYYPGVSASRALSRRLLQDLHTATGQDAGRAPGGETAAGVIHQAIAKFIVSVAMGYGCVLNIRDNKHDGYERVAAALFLAAIAAMWL
jgi:hypothetical protein